MASGDTSCSSGDTYCSSGALGKLSRLPEPARPGSTSPVARRTGVGEESMGLGAAAPQLTLPTAASGQKPRTFPSHSGDGQAAQSTARPAAQAPRGHHHLLQTIPSQCSATPSPRRSGPAGAFLHH